jgi:hypothetical protein
MRPSFHRFGFLARLSRLRGLPCRQITLQCLHQRRSARDRRGITLARLVLLLRQHFGQHLPPTRFLYLALIFTRSAKG